MKRQFKIQDLRFNIFNFEFSILNSELEVWYGWAAHKDKAAQQGRDRTIP